MGNGALYMENEQNLYDSVVDVLTRDFYISHILADKMAKAIVIEVKK